MKEAAQRSHVMRELSHLILISLFLFFLLEGLSFGGVVKGTVYDLETGEPVPFATVQVEGTGRSMLANENGEYRLYLPEGAYQLKFSHVAYYSEQLSVGAFDSVVVQEVHLRPAVIPVEGITVYERAYDPAQKIIREAIARKEEILAKIKAYSCEAYCKLVVRDTAKDDSNNIWLITESQVVSYWEYPDKYKEIINARRHAASWKAVEALIGVGELLNFNANRVELDEYSVVSPTAKDALDYYDYYLLDTVYIDSLRVFRLEIEPKSNTVPLFAGTIDIADSTFDVVGVDVGFNEGFDYPYLVDPRISQRYAEFENELWMPVEIRFSGIVNVDFPFIPIPDVVSYEYVAALHNIKFNAAHPGGTFDEFEYEVAENADEVDSATWDAGQLIPLTDDEVRGYQRIDSIANAPRPLHKRLLGLGLKGLFISTGSNYDVFHFNRVEGAYLGAGVRLNKLVPNTKLKLKSGYAFAGKYWQHNYRFTYTLSKRQRLTIGGEYHDEIKRRPTIISSRYTNPTFAAFTNKTDPFDYYLERGFAVRLNTKVINHTRFNIAYHDYNQYSAQNNTEYSLFRKTKKHRSNPAIIEGKFRSISARLYYDSRKLVKFKDQEPRVYAQSYTRFSIGGEIASPDIIDNDFDFVRYTVRLYRKQRVYEFGTSRLWFDAGASDKTLPPQKYFTVDFGAGLWERGYYFKTLGESNFSGSRAVAAYATHDFGRRLFLKSGLPLVRDIPFTLSIHGGAFWTDFKNHPAQPGDSRVRLARKPYTELGFGLGRIPPFFLEMYFTWQLSDYRTNTFSLSLGGQL